MFVNGETIPSTLERRYSTPTAIVQSSTAASTRPSSVHACLSDVFELAPKIYFKHMFNMLCTTLMEKVGTLRGVP